MIGSVRAELLKLRKRWAIRFVVILFVVLALLLNYGLPYLIYKNPPPNFGQDLPRGTTIADLIRSLGPAHFHRLGLSATSGLGGAIAIILGVLAAGSEYTWGTIKAMVTQKPGRVAVFLGKLIALAIVTLFIAILLMAAAAGASAVIGQIEGLGDPWPAADVIGRAVLAGWLILYMWAMLGVALAVLMRQTALPQGIGIVYTVVVETLLFAIFGSSLQDVERYFPGANATALIRSFGSALRGVLGRTSAQTGPAIDPTQAVLVLLAFALGFVFVTLVLVRRRDLT